MKSTKIYDLVAALQAFHGYEIRVAYRPLPQRRVEWSVQVPKTGAAFAGTHAQVLAWLRGYQAGFHGGRRYTREESSHLEHVIKEIASGLGKSA